MKLPCPERERLFLAALLRGVPILASRCGNGDGLAPLSFLQSEDPELWNWLENPASASPWLATAFSLASGGDGSGPELSSPLPLRSIFSSLYPSPERLQTYQPPCPLEDKQYHHPSTSVPEALRESMQGQWEALKQDLIQFAKLRFPGELDIDLLLSVLKSRLWCVPVSTTLQDVSLHEWCRLSAALVTCLHDTQGKAAFQMIGGDITGIQKYIYNIAHAKALKALKGRSFMIQCIQDLAADELAEELDLTPAHILYASGGKFYVLAPDTEAVREKIPDFAQRWQKLLFDRYEDTLSLVCASVPLNQDHFSSARDGNHSMSEAWREVILALNREKNRKWRGLMEDSPSAFFQGPIPDGEVLTCHATGVDLCTKTELSNAKKGLTQDGKIQWTLLSGKVVYEERGEVNDTPRFIHEEQVLSQSMGAALRHAGEDEREVRDLVYSHSPHTSSIEVLDNRYLTLAKRGSDVRPSPSDRVFRLNGPGALDLEVDSHVRRGWKFYGGDWGLSKDLEQLESRAHGLKRLGMLRLDVDNLGRHFSQGLGARADIVHLVQLSSMLEFFFCGYLNRIRDLYWDPVHGISEKEGEPISEQVVIIYSGGDDACLLGPWNILPDLVLWMREEFRAFTGCHPELSFSAGLTLFSPRYPIFKAAKDAGEAEEEAKHFRKEKDGFCFLGHAVSWDDFRELQEWKARFYSWMSPDPEDSNQTPHPMSKSLLGRLAQFSEAARKDKEERQTKNHIKGSWMWRGCYSLSQWAELSINEPYRMEIHALAARLFRSGTQEAGLIDRIQIATRWTEYLLRKED